MPLFPPQVPNLSQPPPGCSLRGARPPRTVHRQLGIEGEEWVAPVSQRGSPSGANTQVGQEGALGGHGPQVGLCPEKALPFSQWTIEILSFFYELCDTETSGSMVSLNLGVFVYSFTQQTVSEASPLTGPMLGSGEARSAGHSWSGLRRA